MTKNRYQYANRAPVHQRTEPDGFVYDSRTEMLRGLDLIYLEKARVITGLERQKSFELYAQGAGGIGEALGMIKPYPIMVGKNREKIAVYTPDFVYYENGKLVIEDVKGYPDEPSKFRIRVFESLYGVKVTIVKKVKGVGWVTE